MRAPRWTAERVSAPWWAWPVRLAAWWVEDALAALARFFVWSLLALVLCSLGG